MDLEISGFPWDPLKMRFTGTIPAIPTLLAAACVVLQVKGETVVLNGPDEERTREIYETLLQKTGLPAAA